MSRDLDRRLASGDAGTKFKLFVQPRDLPGFGEPETVRVSVPPGEMLPGPADDRFFVVDAVGKRPYDQTYFPQYEGARRDPVQAGPGGHFDHLALDSREFRCATMYATVRRVIDIFEDYFGGRVEFAFTPDFARMELIPLIDWDNAQSGYGFLEFGYGRLAGGQLDRAHPYCENFDVLAHEMGHSIIFATVGYPSSNSTLDYGGFQESAADLVAIVSSLHFDTVVKKLLSRTSGNLFTVNELTRVGELGESRQIRIAFNYEKYDPSVAEPHDRSLPLTGAMFDIFVEIFQKKLVAASLISEQLARDSTQTLESAPDDPAIQLKFDAAYRSRENAFRDALLAARDYFGHLLAKTWSALQADGLSYFGVCRQVLAADRELGGGNDATIRECFQWREIRVPALMVALSAHRLEHGGHRRRRAALDVAAPAPAALAVASATVVTTQTPPAASVTKAAKPVAVSTRVKARR